MVKRVLIVSPRFPPTNAPDHHRVRMMVGVLEQFGWEAEVLAVEPELVDAPLDFHLEKAFPKPPIVHRTKAWNSRWTRKLGLGGLGYRAGWQLARAG